MTKNEIKKIIAKWKQAHLHDLLEKLNKENEESKNSRSSGDVQK